MDYLDKFDVYKSGKWRDNNDIRVETYIPAPYKDIEKGVEELLAWIKKNATVTSVESSMQPYMLCIHLIMVIREFVESLNNLSRGLDINAKKLYSTSYYYHKEERKIL